MKIGLSFLFLILIFNQAVSGQDGLKTDKYISKTFWLRHNLVLRGEVKVYPNNIEFEETDREIHHRGERIKIESIIESKDFSKVIFSITNSRYEVLVLSDSQRNFEKSFKLAFASKPIKESLVRLYCESKMRTKKDVLKCYGFPLRTRITDEGGERVERLYYTCWFLNACISWDTIEIKIKNGKIVDFEETI